MRAVAVLLAGGSGSRVGAGRNKVLLTLHGLPVLAHSVRQVAEVPGIVRVVVVVRPGEEEGVTALVAAQSGELPVSFAAGGSSRHASEWSALALLAPAIDAGDYDVVAIHDSARPLAPVALWTAVLDAAAEDGGAIPVRPQAGLLPRDVSPAAPEEAPASLVAVQTPQAFRAGPLLAAYRAALLDGFEGTDTAACVAAYTTLSIRGVPAPATNLKVTFPEDVALAEALLSP